MAEIRSMTDNLVERLRAEAAVFVGNALQAACGFDAEMDDVTGQLLDEAASELSRLQQALAAAEAERDEAKRIISECCNALPNGAMCRPTASLAFMADIPGEILAVTADLKSRAETAEAKLAALLALQENSNER